MMFLPPSEVWSPHAGAQREAMEIVAREILFYGTRNAGKTVTQLMRWLARVGVGYGHAWSGVLVDVSVTSFDDIVTRSQQFFPRHPSKLRYNKSEKTWYAETGETLRFRLLRRPDQYHENFHGHSYAWVGFNELTKHPSPQLYEMLLSVNRVADDVKTPAHLPPLIPEMFSTCNTEGLRGGAKWVKRRWQKCGLGDIGYHQDEDGYDYAVICGYYSENKSIDVKAYEASLLRATASNPERRASWMHAEWITTGGAFGDIWDDKRVIVEVQPDRLAEVLPVFVALFWGASKPYCAGWFAVANSDTVIAGSRRPAGSLILLHELYGGEEVGLNRGTFNTPSEVLFKVMDETKRLFGNKGVISTIVASEMLLMGGTYSFRNTLQDSFGLMVEASNDTDEAQCAGFQMVRDALGEPKEKRRQLLINKTCEASLETIPDVRVEEEDEDIVSHSTEISCYDMCRIALQHHVRTPMIMETSYAPFGD